MHSRRSSALMVATPVLLYGEEVPEPHAESDGTNSLENSYASLGCASAVAAARVTAHENTDGSDVVMKRSSGPVATYASPTGECSLRAQFSAFRVISAHRGRDSAEVAVHQAT
jgi:hypothetical protein